MKFKQLILKKGWLLAVPLFCTVFGYSQSVRFSEFVNVQNGADAIAGVIEDEQGGFMVYGSTLNLTDNSGYNDAFAAHFDFDGLLTNSLRVSRSDFNYKFNGGIKNPSSPGFYVSGYICDNTNTSSADCDYYFSKLDNSGDTIFTKIISRPDTSDILLDMIQTTPNKILLIGWTDNGTPELINANIFLVTVDTLGNELNRAVYGGSRTDFIRSGTLVSNAGEVLMTGYTKSFGGNDNDSWVLKTDSIGNVEWQMTYNHLSPTGGDGATSLHPLLDGNFIVCGGYDNPELTAAWGYLMKIDSDGNELWTKRYENDLSQGFWSCEVLDDGSILAVGQTNNTNDGSQAGWVGKVVLIE